MEKEEAKESRKCAGSWILDGSEKFGRNRDTFGFIRSTSSGRFGNDRMRSGLRSFEGVFRILFPLLIEFARKIYLKYFEFVHAIWKEERFLDCLNSKNNVSSNTSLEYKSPHRYSALLSSPSLVKTFSTYFKFLANPLAKRQFLGRTISTRKKIDRSKLVRSLFSSPRELNSRIYGDVSAAEFTWKQLNLFRGNGFIKSGKCLSFIEAPRKAIYNLV